MYATRNDEERKQQHHKGYIVEEYVVPYCATHTVARQQDGRSDRYYHCVNELIAILLPLMLHHKGCNRDGEQHDCKWYHHP
jgi:hypothetical protein